MENCGVYERRKSEKSVLSIELISDTHASSTLNRSTSSSYSILASSLVPPSRW